MTTSKDLLYQLYDLTIEAAMRAATWISTQTGVFEGHPSYILILVGLCVIVWVRVS